MAEPIINKSMEKAHFESYLYNTSNYIKINLSKEFLEELQKNTYHGRIDEDVINHIAKALEVIDLISVPDEGEGKITVWEELVENFFCKFYPDSYDEEDEMLDEGDNWGIDLLEFLSRVNSSFDKHMKIDGRTKKSDIRKEEEQSQTKRKYSNTSSTTDEQPNKRWCKAKKFEAIQYSLGPNEEYIAIRRPREGNIDEYWWRIYKFGNLEVLES
ncbi:hypothetical protein Tco_1278635 [Tanacetum coccineum]